MYPVHCPQPIPQPSPLPARSLDAHKTIISINAASTEVNRSLSYQRQPLDQSFTKKSKKSDSIRKWKVQYGVGYTEYTNLSDHLKTTTPYRLSNCRLNPGPAPITAKGTLIGRRFHNLAKPCRDGQKPTRTHKWVGCILCISLSVAQWSNPVLLSK